MVLLPVGRQPLQYAGPRLEYGLAQGVEVVDVVERGVGGVEFEFAGGYEYAEDEWEVADEESAYC